MEVYTSLELFGDKDRMQHKTQEYTVHKETAAAELIGQHETIRCMMENCTTYIMQFCNVRVLCETDLTSTCCW